MKKRSSRTKPKPTRKAPTPRPTPESTSELEARVIVDERFPSHDFRLVAEVAARLAAGAREIARQDGARIARNALNLLDGVRDVVQSREKSRSTILSGLSERAEVPKHLKFAEGKLFILGSDGGGSDARFNDLLKAEIRTSKLLTLRAQRIQAGLSEPSLEEIPQTTAQELNALRNRLKKDGFSRSSLEWLQSFYIRWRSTVDGRRKKN